MWVDDIGNKNRDLSEDEPAQENYTIDATRIQTVNKMSIVVLPRPPRAASDGVAWRGVAAL